MNFTDMFFSSNSRDFVLNIGLGIVLAFVVPYVNAALSELCKQDLFKGGLGIRFMLSLVISLPFTWVIVLFDAKCQWATCLAVALIIWMFIDRNKVRKQVQIVVKWFAMYKYKRLMKPVNVWSEIKNSRNKYCLQEWLERGWRLPNGNSLCGNEERFREDLKRVLIECTTEGLQEWQVQLVCKCGYKFRNM